MRTKIFFISVAAATALFLTGCATNNDTGIANMGKGVEQNGEKLGKVLFYTNFKPMYRGSIESEVEKTFGEGSLLSVKTDTFEMLDLDSSLIDGETEYNKRTWPLKAVVNIKYQNIFPSGNDEVSVPSTRGTKELLVLDLPRVTKAYDIEVTAEDGAGIYFGGKRVASIPRGSKLFGAYSLKGPNGNREWVKAYIPIERNSFDKESMSLMKHAIESDALGYTLPRWNYWVLITLKRSEVSGSIKTTSTTIKLAEDDSSGMTELPYKDIKKVDKIPF